ncbi:MAG: HEAT repeat domain-containing protein [Terracoccus sp.]
MVPDAVLDANPGERARAAADALGDDVLTAWCADLLAQRAEWGDPDRPEIGWVGGRQAGSWGAPERLNADTEYWVRVWAARTLIYVWSPSRLADVVAALGDPAWRVREMCCTVAARWEVGQAADACLRLVDDETPRVRTAAVRVLGAVGEAEHAYGIRDALDDEDRAVRSAAERAWTRLEARLDRLLRP